MIKIGFVWEIESDSMYIVSEDENTIVSVKNKNAQDIEDSIIEALIVIKEIRIDSLKEFESQYGFRSEDIIEIVNEYSY